MAGWHEDFEDCPEVEERYDYSDVMDCECGECDECDEARWIEYESDQDELLAQQELEDFEGLNGWNEEYNDGF